MTANVTDLAAYRQDRPARLSSSDRALARQHPLWASLPPEPWTEGDRLAAIGMAEAVRFEQAVWREAVLAAAWDRAHPHGPRTWRPCPWPTGSASPVPGASGP
jgi:hypothetical protein